VSGPSKSEPRYWATDYTAFGDISDLPFVDEPTDPTDKAAWAAARLQNDVIAQARVLGKAAGYRDWAAMTGGNTGIGLRAPQLQAVARGETWLRLPQAAALTAICKQPLLTSRTVIERLLRELKELRAENEALREELRRRPQP
jgi:choline dehydrogenase-like flavoprotein